MRFFMDPRISMPLTAMLVTVALAVPLAAVNKLVAFSGSLQGQETDVLQGAPPTGIKVDGLVRGVATHLGRFTLAYDVAVKIPEGSATGFVTITAANGDLIYAMLTGQGTPVPDTPGVNRIVEINTITGGTGRFIGAEGSFTVERLVDLGTGLTSGSFHGSITTPGQSAK